MTSMATQALQLDKQTAVEFVRRFTRRRSELLARIKRFRYEVATAREKERSSASERLLREVSRASPELLEISDALNRIRNRKFGACRKCDRALPVAELWENPYSKHCGECRAAKLSA